MQARKEQMKAQIGQELAIANAQQLINVGQSRASDGTDDREGASKASKASCSRRLSQGCRAVEGCD